MFCLALCSFPKMNRFRICENVLSKTFLLKNNVCQCLWFCHLFTHSEMKPNRKLWARSQMHEILILIDPLAWILHVIYQTYNSKGSRVSNIEDGSLWLYSAAWHRLDSNVCGICGTLARRLCAFVMSFDK